MTDKQQNLEQLAKQAEAILNGGLTKADDLLIKTARIRSEINQLKNNLTEELARRYQADELK
jgi:uncharacterized protein Yka (UPF0111/DUF47 family)